MELAGNEQKIRALFLELKFADESVAPEFSRMWSRAEATSPVSSSVFKLSFAMSLALIILCSLVLWSRNWQRTQSSTRDVIGVSQQPGAMPVLPSVMSGSTQLVIAESHHRNKARRSVRKLAVRHRPDRNDANSLNPETIALSSWLSPTAMLLQSPADDVLTSLPQLDLSVKDLRTFLPDTLQ